CKIYRTRLKEAATTVQGRNLLRQSVGHDVSNTIWRWHCSTSDEYREGSDMAHVTPLETRIKTALKFRARVEHERALHRDRRAAEMAIFWSEGVEESPSNASQAAQHYDALVKIWHHPPMITISEDGISFGAVFQLGEDEVASTEVAEAEDVAEAEEAMVPPAVAVS
ncbi:hypothetical protein BGZ94_006475, partial [Podila epigama]